MGTSSSGAEKRVMGHENSDSEQRERFEQAYNDLHALACAHFQLQSGSHTLQPTALVHEAYLKLASTSGNGSNDREHMLAIASHAMRQVLVDHARKKSALKRGGGGNWSQITLSGIGTEAQACKVLEIDDAITKLAELDERQAKIVELRYFGGLTVERVAEVLGINKRTVYLDWRMARAWLIGQYGLDADG